MVGYVQPPREEVYDRMLALWLPYMPQTFKTVTRRWKSIWDDPQAKVAALPMLVQWDATEDATWTNRGIGRIWTLATTLEIYAKIPDSPNTPGVPDKTTPGSAVINPLLDALDQALLDATNAEGMVTLGGLVTDCRIEGTIQKAFGDEDPSGLCGALVPIRVLVTV